MIKINKNSTIYIACPPNTYTGGPELLHQLAFKLNTRGLNAKIFYFPIKYKSDPTLGEFKEYIDSFSTNIKDDTNNILIVPELLTELLSDYKKIQKVIWWLSVDFYKIRISGRKEKLKMFFRINKVFNIFNSKMRKQIDLHLVQSKYAEEYLKNYNISNIKYLSDYLRKDFIDKAENLELKNKLDLVLYNPKKGLLFTQKLIKQFPHINWKPIVNYTPNEVVELIASSKVYIDFGFHPGKDRIPRESVLLKCCLITNKQGSAFYNEDVPILEEFKFDELNCDINEIGQKIQNCISNYDEEIKKFENYRLEILRQENNFDSEIDFVFKSSM